MPSMCQGQRSTLGIEILDLDEVLSDEYNSKS